MDLLSGLNDPQRLAVTHETGPLLIFAGAGSGKTRTLTHRIAHLVTMQGVSPFRILAVTFTNKAAREMRERLEALLGPIAKRMWLGTFHALCAQMLRIHGERIGLPQRFAIFDADDQLRLVKDVLKEQNLDSDRFPPARVLGRISDAKNQLKTPEQVASEATRPNERVQAALYRRYQERLRMASALDFDDLLSEAVRLLNESSESLDHWSERFQHILIDEFQDVNEAQFRWAQLLASKHRNICVVGDDDQSIYAWRGADVKIILDFEKKYPDALTIRLEQNYRSTQTILDAAYGVISHNFGRADKRLWTEESGGEQILVYGALNAQEEAYWVVRHIETLRREKGLDFADFAILCRVNAQSRPFEEAFMRARVPLKLVGTQRFYDRREIRDLMAYLKFLYNSNDSVATARLINTPPRGIGAATVSKLDEIAAQSRRSLGATILDEETAKFLAPAVGRKIEPLRRLLARLGADARESATLADLVEKILERTQFLEFLRAEKDEAGLDREANVDEFINAVETFDMRLAEDLNEAGETSEVWLEDDPLRLGQFLSETALEGGGDKNAETEDAVTFMTLHSAKGLEFPVVFLTGMEQGLLPHARAIYSESADAKDLEEERRLMYVGLTRARHRGDFDFRRPAHDARRTESTQPSQFLDEIPPQLLVREGIAGGGSRVVQQRSSAWNSLPPRGLPTFSPAMASAAKDAPPATFKIGDKVSHGTYGEGLVVGAAGQGGPGEWVEVAFFGGVGKKKIDRGVCEFEQSGRVTAVEEIAFRRRKMEMVEANSNLKRAGRNRNRADCDLNWANCNLDRANCNLNRANSNCNWAN